ncbi:MAG: PepSY-like domain-containing protein [Bacteroides sp.]|nr:PepSY-like domain-containing protein [Bacteroides sp.]
MKKVFSFLFVALMAILPALAGEIVTQDINQLPQQARSFITKYFGNVKVSHIKIDSDFLQGKKYEVTLTDRTEIDFDSKGRWTEVDCQKKAVPAGLVPTYIQSYVNANFPRETITKMERKHGHIEAELSNDYTLKFSKKGKFIGMDN